MKQVHFVKSKKCPKNCIFWQTCDKHMPHMTKTYETCDTIGAKHMTAHVEHMTLDLNHMTNM